MQSPAERLKNASYGAVWVCGIPVRPHRVGVSTGVKTGVFKITRIFEIGGKIMSKVFISTRYCKTGKPVGGGFTEYISKRDGVDKTINTRYRSEVFTQYAAERPGVVKMGEHGLFGQEDYVNLHKASQEIYHHKGIVWEEIISLRQNDAERLGYDTPDAWRNLLRSKQFEIASYHRIPAENMKWYAAFHKEEGHYHVHFLVYNKEPGGEFICPRDYERYKESLTKTIFKDEMKQIYDERESLRNKIVASVKEKVSEFKVNIGEAPDGFTEAFNELKFSLDGYTGKKNYQFLSREQKEKVDAVVKIVCKDQNLQNLYQQWCQVQLALLKTYRKDPEECFDSLENNLNLHKRLGNDVLIATFYDNRQNNLYTNKEQSTPAYGGIVFALCKMFEQSIDYDIKEGFTKSIVDSKERTKEYRKDSAMGIHHGM